MQWVMAAILICGATLFTSCMNEDNPVDPATNLSEMIIGKWIVADLKGKPAPTNVKMVTTFISTTKAIASSSKVDFTEKDSKWNVYREDDVVIAGNKVTLTGYSNEHTTLINEYDVSSISDTELIGKWKHITIVDGVEARGKVTAPARVRSSTTDRSIAGSIMPMEHTCIMLRTATTGCHTRALPLASTSWTAHCSAPVG